MNERTDVSGRSPEPGLVRGFRFRETLNETKRDTLERAKLNGRGAGRRRELCWSAPRTAKAEAAVRDTTVKTNVNHFTK